MSLLQIICKNKSIFFWVCSIKESIFHAGMIRRSCLGGDISNLWTLHFIIIHCTKIVHYCRFALHTEVFDDFHAEKFSQILLAEKVLMIF